MTDIDYYKNIFGGVVGEDTESILSRSRWELERFINGKPVTKEQENALQEAVCLQAEYMEGCGGISAWRAAVTGTGGGFTIGSFSMSGGSSAVSGGSAAVNGCGICSSALDLLGRQGLLYRAVRVI